MTLTLPSSDMPFALTLIGLLLIITGFQNTYKQFGAQVQSDFTGQGNFLYWFLAIIVVGSIGYVQSLQTFSRAFMALILIGIVLSIYKQNPSFFNNLTSGLSQGTTTPVDPIGAPLPASGGGGSSSGQGSGLFNEFKSAAGFANTIVDVVSFL